MQRPPRRLPQQDGSRNTFKTAGHAPVNLRRGTPTEEGGYQFINHNVRQTKPNVITYGSPQAGGFNEKLGFAIEGTRTGEEVLVEKVEPRQAQKRPSLPSSGDSGHPSAELEALKKKVAQLQAEKKTSSDKLLKMKKERDTLLQTNLVISEELVARRQLEQSLQCQREEAWRGLWVRGLKSYSALETACKESEKRFQALTEKTESNRVEQDTARNELLEKIKTLQSETKSSATDSSNAQNELLALIEKLRAELADKENEHTREIHELERELSSTQERLSRSINEVEDLTKKRAEETFLVSQCRMFVRNICNPGFNVVKDASLQPVDRNRTEPTGYVLVPLTTLLHGYTLLPDEERKGVIDSYDERVKNA